MKAHADRNLLVGILALQMDFISREQLIAGMNAWVLDKQKPLGMVLLEQKVLSSERRVLLDALVHEHLKQHGNDPERSLAALSSAETVQRNLDQIADADVQASLAHMSASRVATKGHADDPVQSASQPTTVGMPTSSGTRFRILRAHSKGGLGQIYVAEDSELHREVALKEIQECHADNAQSRTRFLAEAEITGGLEHPGIVPVYGLGTYADGRPFYAMRFVKGDSLKEAIKQFHRKDEGGRMKDDKDSSDSSFRFHPSSFSTVDFRKLLGRFLDVCNAIQYAHDRGVLHRDLKPGNIMLGPYGETLVVDWGLAKAGVGDKSAEPALSREPSLHLHASSGSADTVAGTAIGTPQYMSPEQAAGRIDLLGPASDVYSLGATLYCLLTGRPPFDSDEAGHILHKVKQGDFPPPRRYIPDVPRPLEAICLRAMAKEPQARYATPRALADDLDHWLADEPVAAWAEPWTVKTGRWMRRHKSLVSGAVAVLLFGVLALGVGLVVVGGLNQKLEQANTNLAGTNRSLEQTNTKLDIARHDADTRRKEAETNFEKAFAVVDRMLTRVGDKDLAHIPHMDQERRRLLEDALEFYKEFLTERSVDPIVRSETARAYTKAAVIYDLLGRYEQAEAGWQRARELQQALAAEFPSESAYRQELAISHRALGALVAATERRPQAEPLYLKALEIQLALVQDHPARSDYQAELVNTYLSLARMYQLTSRLEDAAGIWEKALPLAEPLARANLGNAAYQNTLATCYNNQGVLLRELGQLAKAVQVLEAARTIWDRLVREHPESRGYPKDLAGVCANLGADYRALERPGDAQRAYEDALKTYKPLIENHPHIPEYQEGLAKTHNNFGFFYNRLRNPAKAEHHYKEALALHGELAKRYPKQVAFTLNFASTGANWAQQLRENGRAEEALDWYDRSIAAGDAARALEPKNAYARQTLHVAHFGRAQALQRLDRSPESLKDWKRVVELSEGLQEDSYRVYRPRALAYLGEHARSMKEVEALAAGDKRGWVFEECARACTLCSGAVRDDAILPPAEKAKLMDRNLARAVELLSRAAEAGMYPTSAKVKGLKNNSLFEPLRLREDYLKLIRELEAKTP